MNTSTKHFLIYGFFLLCILPAFGQEKTLDLTIVNADTGEPVSYATVSFPSQQYGFSANASGQFMLPVHFSDMDKRIAVSSIGFQRFETTIGQLVNDQVQKIQLQPVATVLQEVLVKAQKENAADIVVSAEKNLKKLLGKNPYYLYGIYREQVKKNGKYVGYTDAYGVFHISGYQPTYNRKNELFAYDLAQWKNIRRSNYQIEPLCRDRDVRLMGINKLAKCKAEYLYNGPLINNGDFRFTIDSLTVYDNTDVLVLAFIPISSDYNYYGRVYVKADDYAVLRMEVVQADASQLLYDDCETKISTVFTLSFIKIDDKYYPDRIHLNAHYELNGNRIEESIEIRGSEFRENNVARLNQAQRVVIYNEMLNPRIAFEPNFWETYQVSLPKQAKEDLGKEVPLQDQFLYNNGKRIIPLPEGFGSYEELSRDQDVFRMFMGGDF